MMESIPKEGQVVPLNVSYNTSLLSRNTYLYSINVYLYSVCIKIYQVSQTYFVHVFAHGNIFQRHGLVLSSF